MVSLDLETSLASEEEQSKLAELRSILSDDIRSSPSSSFDEVTGDIRLLRFIRSFPSLSDAANAYRSMMQSRASRGLDEVRRIIVENGLDHAKAPHQSALDEIAPLFTTWDAGRAPNGDIITVARPANIDLQKIFEVVTPEQLMENFRYHLEILSVKVDRASREGGRLVKVVRVQDMAGVGIGILAFIKRVVKPFMQDTQLSNAGIIRQVLLLNVPDFFTVVFGVVSPLMNEAMKKRINPVSADYKPTLIKACGGGVFQRLEEAEKAGPGDIKSLGLGQSSPVVPAWGKVEFDVCVRRGDIVKWDLRPDGSLSFHAKSYGLDGNTVVIKSVEDISHQEQGEYQAVHDCVLNLVLNNSATWLSQRVVDCNIQLVEVK